MLAMQHEIDDIDRRILNILQQDATLPLKNIAEQVHASVATCQRRIQFMMDTGVITKQVAIINPNALGYHLTALVMIKLTNRNTETYQNFAELMHAHPQVASCYATAGEFDYVLLMHSKNMADYHRFTREVLNDSHNVASLKSEFIMNFTEVSNNITL